MRSLAKTTAITTEVKRLGSLAKTTAITTEVKRFGSLANIFNGKKNKGGS